MRAYLPIIALTILASSRHAVAQPSVVTPTKSQAPDADSPLDAYARTAGAQQGVLAGTALTVPDGDYELSLRGKNDWGGIAFAQLAFAFGVSRNVEVWFDALGIVDEEGVLPFAGGGLKVVVHRGRRYQVSLGGGLRLPGLAHAVAAVTGCFDQRCFVVGTLNGGGAAADGAVGFASAGLVVGASWLRAFLEVDVVTENRNVGAFGVGGLRVGSIGGAFEVGYGKVLGQGTPTHGWWLGARLRL